MRLRNYRMGGEQGHPYHYEWGTYQFATCCGSLFTDNAEVFSVVSRGCTVGWFPVDHQFEQVDVVIPVADGYGLHIRMAPEYYKKDSWGVTNRFFDRDRHGDITEESQQRLAAALFPNIKKRSEFNQHIASIYAESWVPLARWNAPKLQPGPGLNEIKEPFLLAITTPEQGGLLKEITKDLNRPLIWQNTEFAANFNTCCSRRLKLSVFGAKNA